MESLVHVGTTQISFIVPYIPRHVIKRNTYRVYVGGLNIIVVV